MLKTVLDATVPALTFLLMVAVGLDLTAEDFRRVARRFRVVALATAAQVFVWPPVAAALLALLPLKSYVATGILLVAVCPSGGMANVYTYLGRANLALSVTLTAMSSLTAMLTMPLLLVLFKTRLDDPASLDAPVPLMIGQLLVMLLLPMLLGMLLRRARPAFTERHGRTMLLLSIAGLAALLALVIALEWDRLSHDFAEISLAVALLTTIMLAAGFAAGRACALAPPDRFALAMVLVVRNVAIATAVAVTVLGRIEFAAFATAYFLNQVPFLVAALAMFRLARSAEPATPQ
jgi:BASS family bile acid:Na+ symporter